MRQLPAFASIALQATRRSFAQLVLASLVVMGIGSAAVAQQTSQQARIGLLCSTVCTGGNFPALFHELRKLGWVEGSTIVIDRKPADGRYERLPQLASELVQSRPKLVVAISPPAARAAKDATSEIPIVFLYVADPVGVGLAQSLARPGGNVTGVATLVPGGFMGKSVELLRELLPTAGRIAAMINPNNEVLRRIFPNEVPGAAAERGFQLDVVEVREPGEIEAAVARAKAQGADALFVVGDPIFHTPPNRIPDLAAQLKLPAIYLPRAVVQAGGLMSYSPDFDAIARRGAHYIDRILRGANPRELPIEQPTTYQLVINAKTANALGLTISPTLLARADEVIE